MKIHKVSPSFMWPRLVRSLQWHNLLIFLFKKASSMQMHIPFLPIFCGIIMQSFLINFLFYECKFLFRYYSSHVEQGLCVVSATNVDVFQKNNYLQMYFPWVKNLHSPKTFFTVSVIRWFTYATLLTFQNIF